MTDLHQVEPMPEDLPNMTEPAVALPELPVEEVDAQSDNSRPLTATQLVELALERYSLGVTAENEAYALPATGGHVVMMLRDARASLRGELAREFFRENRKAPSSSALTDALVS